MTEEADEFIRAVMADMLDGQSTIPYGRGRSVRGAGPGRWASPTDDAAAGRCRWTSATSDHIARNADSWCGG